jgi:hypothetical protein
LSASVLSVEDVQRREDAANSRLHMLDTFVKAPAQGANCERIVGEWAMPAQLGDSSTQVACGIAGAYATHTTPVTGVPDRGEIQFFNRDGRFTRNYQISVSITSLELDRGCAGIVAYADNDGQTYVTLICGTGGIPRWAITYYKGNQPTVLASGILPQDALGGIGSDASGFDLTASVYGTYMGFRTNGVDLGSVNVVLTIPSHVGLTLTAPSGITSATRFSNFEFDPVPDLL